MKLEILDLAKGDFIDGYRFYEAQEPSLGGYFLDTLYSDIDSLRIFDAVQCLLFGTDPIERPHRDPIDSISSLP